MKVLISSWRIQFTNMKWTLQSTFSSCQSSRLFDEAVLKLTVPFIRIVEDQLSNCISCTSVFYGPLPVCSELTSCVWERRGGGSKWMAPPMHFILQGMSEGQREWGRWKDEVEGRKIEMTGETDWRGRGASKSAIKTIFVLDYWCFYTQWQFLSRAQLFIC